MTVAPPYVAGIVHFVTVAGIVPNFPLRRAGLPGLFSVERMERKPFVFQQPCPFYFSPKDDTSDISPDFCLTRRSKQ